MSRRKVLPILLVLMLLVAAPVYASGNYANPVRYRGQGLIAEGSGGFALEEEICEVANGAEAEGGYLLWILTATRSSNADITGPWGPGATMTKTGNGVFKYVSAWYDPGTLIGNVVGTYSGNAKNAQLVISHGCAPASSPDQ